MLFADIIIYSSSYRYFIVKIVSRSIDLHQENRRKRHANLSTTWIRGCSCDGPHTRRSAGYSTGATAFSDQAGPAGSVDHGRQPARHAGANDRPENER